MTNEKRFKAYRDDFFYGMEEDQVEFIRFLDLNPIQGGLNPYRVFDYRLVAEEYCTSEVTSSC